MMNPSDTSDAFGTSGTFGTSSTSRTSGRSTAGSRSGNGSGEAIKNSGDTITPNRSRSGDTISTSDSGRDRRGSTITEISRRAFQGTAPNYDAEITPSHGTSTTMDPKQNQREGKRNNQVNGTQKSNMSSSTTLPFTEQSNPRSGFSRSSKSPKSSITGSETAINPSHEPSHFTLQLGKQAARAAAKVGEEMTTHRHLDTNPVAGFSHLHQALQRAATAVHASGLQITKITESSSRAAKGQYQLMYGTREYACQGYECENPIAVHSMHVAHTVGENTARYHVRCLTPLNCADIFDLYSEATYIPGFEEIGPLDQAEYLEFFNHPLAGKSKRIAESIRAAEGQGENEGLYQAEKSQHIPAKEINRQEHERAHVTHAGLGLKGAGMGIHRDQNRQGERKYDSTFSDTTTMDISGSDMMRKKRHLEGAEERMRNQVPTQAETEAHSEFVILQCVGGVERQCTECGFPIDIELGTQTMDNVYNIQQEMLRNPGARGLADLDPVVLKNTESEADTNKFLKQARKVYAQDVVELSRRLLESGNVLDQCCSNTQELFHSFYIGIGVRVNTAYKYRHLNCADRDFVRFMQSRGIDLTNLSVIPGFDVLTSKEKLTLQTTLQKLSEE